MMNIDILLGIAGGQEIDHTFIKFTFGLVAMLWWGMQYFVNLLNVKIVSLQY